MRIALIAALDRNRVIGRDGGLPWKLPDDLRHFMRATLGKPLIMGRRTFDSLAGPLPGRRNIVLSRDPDYRPEGCLVARGPDQALAAAAPAEEVMICGGAGIYALFLPRARRLILTLVDAEVEGDVHFPAWDPGEFKEVAREEHAADSRHALPFSIVTFERRGSPRQQDSGISV